MFDPGGCSGDVRGCPFLGGWARDGLGWIRSDAVMISKAGAFSVGGGLVHHFPREAQAICYALRITVDRDFPETRLGQEETARSYGSCGVEHVSRNAMERGA